MRDYIIQKLNLHICLIFLVFLSSCGQGTEDQSQTDTPQSIASSSYKEGELLVRFKTLEAGKAAVSPHSIIGASLIRRIEFGENPPVSPFYKGGVNMAKGGEEGFTIDHVRLPAGISVEDAISRYMADPNVEYAEPNYIVRKAAVPNDPSFSLQWGLQNTGQTIAGDEGTFTGKGGADIHAPDAWDIHTGDGGSTNSPVVVAVIDTGVDYTHPDLSANIWSNTGEIPGNGIDDDGNGYEDDIRGWNFAYNSNNPMDDDVDGHGTHVAGIIGAVGNNGIGVSGVNWSVNIMPLKFLDRDGGGDIANAVASMSYAVKMGAKVINASYTYPQSCVSTPPSLTERDAIKKAGDAGVLFVAAAGNYACNNDTTPFYPASHGLPNIISVAASEQNDNKISWSNYGAKSVHLGAPGVNIYSTIRQVLGSYGYMSGTSMASPFVAGAAGLLFSYHPEYTDQDVKNAILNSVDKVAGFSTKTISGGRLNLSKALGYSGNPEPPLNEPPAAPTLLSSLTASASRVELTWTDASSNEDGFKIERKNGNSDYIEIATLGQDITSYADISVSDGTIYLYRVRAYNALVDSAYSNELTVITPLAAPTAITAKAVSPFSIELNWMDNSSMEEGYRIERMAPGEPEYSAIATVNADTTAYTDEGLSPASFYRYRITGFNSIAGDSPYAEADASTDPLPSSGDNLQDLRCFIATAAYGSPLDSRVDALRRFRDKYLIANFKFQIAKLKIEIPNIIGKAFVKLYYKVSPPMARSIASREYLKKGVRVALAPLIWLAEVSTAEAMSSPTGKASQDMEYAEGELLVKFKEGIPSERALEVIKKKGAEVIKFIEGIKVYHIRLRSSQSVPDAVKEFSAFKEVEYAEPNYRVRKAR